MWISLWTRCTDLPVLWTAFTLWPEPKNSAKAKQGHPLSKNPSVRYALLQVLRRQIVRPLKNILFCPTFASGSDFNPQNTKCIPVVKIFAFLDLEQNSTFFKGLLVPSRKLLPTAHFMSTKKPCAVAVQNFWRIQTRTLSNSPFSCARAFAL